MTNPYRALCAELLAALKSWSPHGGGPRKCWEDREEEADLIARAETELAQPGPEGPTDEELTLTYVYAVAAAVGNKRGPYTTEDAEAAQLAGLRAVHAKWGTLTPQPPSPISDATLNQWICDHLRYTAREGGDSLRAAALDACLAAGFDPFHHPAPQ
jgi:hypothetical protein